MIPRLSAAMSRPRALRVRRALVVALVVVPLLATAGAQEDGAGGATVEEIARDGTAIEAELAIVGLDAAWRATTGLSDIPRAMVLADDDPAIAPIANLIAVTRSMETTRILHEQVESELREAALQRVVAIELERSRLIDRNRADAHLRGTVALLQAVAVDMFAGNGDDADELLGADGEALLVAQRTVELRGHTLEEMLDRHAQAIAALDLAEARLGVAIERRIALDEDHARLSAEARALARSRNQLEAAARAQLPIAADAFVLAAVPRGGGMSIRALDAYISAELQMTEWNPGCRIGWRTIAAVGGVEGAHGAYGGRTLGVDGTSDSDIVGLPLDGTSVDNFGDVVAAIADTDNGEYDGDTVHDRAVGPMQIIPQTWEMWQQDGDGDGEMNPHDLDDAALAAAAYLCNYGSLRDWENWKNAVFGYNHSAHYVASVKASLDRVRRIQLPDPVEPVELRQEAPYGTYVPMPIPEPEDPASVTDAGQPTG